MIPSGDTPTGDRFWRRIEVSSSGCWVWSGQRDRKGYGRFFFNRSRWRLHRLTWTWVNGPIPRELQVCHKCDTPSCCNPDHLFLGTALTNNQDKVQKGRSCYGDKNHFAKINRSDALSLLDKFNQGRSRRSLAEEYGISYSHAVQIINGRRWRRLHG